MILRSSVHLIITLHSTTMIIVKRHGALQINYMRLVQKDVYPNAINYYSVFVFHVIMH